LFSLYCNKLGEVAFANSLYSMPFSMCLCWVLFYAARIYIFTWYFNSYMFKLYLYIFIIKSSSYNDKYIHCEWISSWMLFILRRSSRLLCFQSLHQLFTCICALEFKYFKRYLVYFNFCCFDNLIRFSLNVYSIVII